MTSLAELVSFPELDQPKPFSFFTGEQLSLLDKTRIPKHIAIIPDGNRRWAKSKGFEPIEGHRHGADIFINVVKAGKELGVKAITFFTFSTENWQRDQDEVQGIFWIIHSYLKKKCSEMVELGIRFQTIGDLSKLPLFLLDTIAETKANTVSCSEIDMVLAINYGGRDELCRAIQGIAADCVSKKIGQENITAELVSAYLDTKKWPDPELLIRTSGEMRISNFLLWQLSYAEIYVSNILWPDYKACHLFDAVYNYQKRERRFGGL
ncbi:MAG TPA: polyprenyl diphosphate synthase [Parachlamydiaceae bacterium]|nr:polyprenyl diphosphate synthase [Parachlamydiaceae bacterium]